MSMGHRILEFLKVFGVSKTPPPEPAWSGEILPTDEILTTDEIKERFKKTEGGKRVFYDEVATNYFGPGGIPIENGSHVEMFDEKGQSVRQLVEQRAVDCSSFVASGLPEVPKFEEDDWVWVNSKCYGRWLGRVESYHFVGDHFRYTIVSDGLLIWLQPETHRELRRRHVLVPEHILEPYERPAPPTGSAEAVAMAYALGRGFPVNEVAGGSGLWGFSSPTSSLESLKAWAEENGKEWTSPAAQAQYMVEHFGPEGGQMFVPVTEDQEIGQDPASEWQLEPLHREFLLTIKYLLDRDPEFAEKMRNDLLELWHEDKVAKGLTVEQALGMTEDEYSAWVERRG